MISGFNLVPKSLCCPEIDGLAKSTSAVLRQNFVVAAQLQARFANRPYSLFVARPASEAFYEVILSETF
jgi:hypothetical protein